jgi:hypothetical protein
METPKLTILSNHARKQIKAAIIKGYQMYIKNLGIRLNYAF